MAVPYMQWHNKIITYGRYNKSIAADKTYFLYGYIKGSKDVTTDTSTLYLPDKFDSEYPDEELNRHIYNESKGDCDLFTDLNLSFNFSVSSTVFLKEKMGFFMEKDLDEIARTKLY